MTIQLLELHISKNEGVRTFGFTLFFLNGRSLIEVWKGKYSFWVDLFFVRVFEK